MPAAQSRIVRECHRYSAQADAIAASASDEQTKAAFLEIAKRWLDIALTYESGEQSIRLRKKRWQGGPGPVCGSAPRTRSGLMLNHIPTIADMRTLDFLAPAIAQAQQLVR